MKAVKEMIKLAQIPFKAIKGNLMFDKSGYVWAYYRIIAEETNPNNFEELENLRNVGQRFFENIAEIWRI